MHSVITNRPSINGRSAKSLNLGEVDVGICRIGDGDTPNDKAAPGQIHAAPDIDFPAKRALGRVTDALLNAIGLQIEIDAEENERSQCDDTGGDKKKTLGKNKHAGKLRNFSGM